MINQINKNQPEFQASPLSASDLRIGKINYRAAALDSILKGYENNRHPGSASTKTRAQVRGGGRKPWRQKGTGRARAGSNRSPLWRGGGVTFGPKPYKSPRSLNRKVKIMARRLALLEKVNTKQLFLIKSLPTSIKRFNQGFSKPIKKSLLVIEPSENELARKITNDPEITIITNTNLNPYLIKTHRTIIFTAGGLKSYLK